jgi:hypothetical protein
VCTNGPFSRQCKSHDQSFAGSSILYRTTPHHGFTTRSQSYADSNTPSGIVTTPDDFYFTTAEKKHLEWFELQKKTTRKLRGDPGSLLRSFFVFRFLLDTRSRSCDVKVSDEGKTMSPSPDHLSSPPIIEFIFVHSHNVPVLDVS